MSGKKVIKNSIIFSFFSFLINGINFILIPVYTKYLSVDEYGAMASIAISTAFFTAFFTFGLNGAFSRLYFEVNENEEAGSLLLTAFITNLVLSTAIVGFLLLTNGLFLDYAFRSVKYDPYLRYSLYISYFNVFSVVPLSILLVKGNALKYRILTSSYFLLTTLFTFINLLVFKEGLLGILKAQLYANLIMAVYYLYSTGRAQKIAFNKKYSKKLLVFGLPIMLYTIMGMMIEQSSKYFVERFLSLKDLGIYNLAYQFSSIIILMNSAINMAWVPVYFAESIKNENSPMFHLFAKYLFQIISLLALCIAVFQKYILHLMVNKSYENAELYIPLFVYVFVIANTYWILFINPIFQAKKTKYLPLIAIISGAVSIVSCIVFIPGMGLKGAILSVLIGNLTMNLLAFLVVNRYMTLRYNHLQILFIIGLSIVFFLLSLYVHNSILAVELALKLVLVGLFILSLKLFKLFSVSEIRMLAKK